MGEVILPKGEHLAEYNRKYKSEQMKGSKNPNFGGNKGKDNPMFGRKQTEETKGLIRQKAIERWLNPKNRDKIRIGVLKYFKEHPDKREYLSFLNKGKTLSEETKKKQSESMKSLYLNHPEKHPNAIMRKNRKMTRIEKITKEFFEGLRFKIEEDFIYQYLVSCSKGTKWIDFYFPKLKLGIECDGEYWHRDEEKDRIRDEEILSFLGKGNIIEHLTEKEIFSLRYLQGIKYV